MDSPQALSTVYAIAAKALAVREPLESLVLEKPVPYKRTNLVAATTNVTGLDVSSVLDDDVEEDMVFQACGLVLAKAVKNTASSPEEVLGVFEEAFNQLAAEYCELAMSSDTRDHNIVSVSDALELEIATMNSWPHLKRSRRSE